jgi:alpha-L-fucosidase
MEVGTWLETNGEAIYGTSPWKVFRDGSPLDDESGRVPGGSPGAPVDVRFTAKGNSVYVICLSWPENEIRVRVMGRRGTPSQTIVAVRMLGSPDEVEWRQSDDALTLSVPRAKPGRHAFVYRIDFGKG